MYKHTVIGGNVIVKDIKKKLIKERGVYVPKHNKKGLFFNLNTMKNNTS